MTPCSFQTHQLPLHPGPNFIKLVKTLDTFGNCQRPVPNPPTSSKWKQWIVEESEVIGVFGNTSSAKVTVNIL